MDLRSRLMAGPVGSVAVLASGAALAQIITLAFSPLVTRLYGPSAFGVLSVFTSVVAVIGAVSTLAYALAIALPRRTVVAYQLLKLSFVVALGASVVLSVIIAAFGSELVELIGLQAITEYLWLLPAAVFLASTAQILENWHIRHQYYRVLAGATVIQATVAGSARTFAGLINPTAPVLVVLSVLVQAVQAAVLASAARSSVGNRHAQSRGLRARRYAILLAIGRRYRGFPLYRAPQLLLNLVSRSAPVILLAGMFGTTAAGLYAIAQTVVYLPFTLVAQSIGQVLLQRFSSERHRGGQLRRPVVRATVALACIGAVPFATIALIGPWLFGTVFGAEWTEAGEYARWLALWVFFHFINVPAVQSLVVSDAQSVLLRWEIVTTSAKLALLIVVGTQTSDALFTVAAYSVFGAIAYIVLIWSGIARAAQSEQIGHG